MCGLIFRRHRIFTRQCICTLDGTNAYPEVNLIDFSESEFRRSIFGIIGTKQRWTATVLLGTGVTQMTNWKQIVKPVDGSTFTATTRATPREKFAANLKTQIALFKDAKKEGKRHFVTKGDQTKFSARMGNMAVELLPGKREVMLPTKDFEAVIGMVVADVEKGEFDTQLNKIAENYQGRRKKSK